MSTVWAHWIPPKRLQALFDTRSHSPMPVSVIRTSASEAVDIFRSELTLVFNGLAEENGTPYGVTALM